MQCSRTSSKSMFHKASRFHRDSFQRQLNLIDFLVDDLCLNLAIPTAETIISARLVCSAKFVVRLWQIVVVAFLFSIISIMGFPTIMLLPMMNDIFIFKFYPVIIEHGEDSFGVGRCLFFLLCNNALRLSRWNPSTSLGRNKISNFNMLQVLRKRKLDKTPVNFFVR